MHTKIATVICFIFLIFATGLAACGPAETLVPEKGIEITNVIENKETAGQIEQTKIFNQCSAAGPINAEIRFSQSSSETNQKELVLNAGASGEVGVSVAAKVKVEASIQQHFATINTTAKDYQEVIRIEVPAHAQVEYRLIWKETRREGTIEYLENGEKKFANYSYRVGLDFASSEAKDISCLVTVTPSPTFAPPTQTPHPEPTATDTIAIEKFITEGCISSKIWKTVSTDQDTLNTIAIKSDACYDTGSLGIFPDRYGSLHILDEKKRTALASGIYTPINSDAVIEFKVYVTSMYIANPAPPAYINFAVAPWDDPMTAKNTARFKLQVEEQQDSPLIYFVLADTGENNGAKFPSQHYEYGRTYTIRFELTGSIMSVFINNIKLNETLSIPPGLKAFYIGYSLPPFAGIDAKITSVTIDGLPK